VTYSLSPAPTEQLQCRPVHTGAALGSVSTVREETWGERNSSVLGEVLAVETRSGSEVSWFHCGWFIFHPVAAMFWI